MKKIWLTLSMLLTPILALADSSMSFTPPSTDYSVIFLENIFGIVDGVLHGSGSQIMGNMFGVFNSAVLALGGIVVMYTLIVGTMNTAHEGQMLGQKWSSIWIPVRATVGLAMLIPKSSGYCLMQIFIMWVVVQGIGAADKIWNSALDYLNRGGAIMLAQMNPNSTTSSSSTANNTALQNIAQGAAIILSGLACMKSVQTLLETNRSSYLTTASAGGGSCSGVLTTAVPNWDYFCNNPVPDFISTVNVVDYLNSTSSGFVSACDSKYSSSPLTDAYKVDMPNFSTSATGTTYTALNGVCGTISWSDFDASSLGVVKSNTLSCSDIDTIRQSRAVAIQQMYSDLTPVALEMVSNNPYITNSKAGSNDLNPAAKYQFGVPLMESGVVCNGANTSCTNWGPSPSLIQPTLLTGYEFQDAMIDYDGIMLPSLNMVNSMKSAHYTNNLREFISGSEEEGWIMAGSYFFDLAYINNNGQTVDSQNSVVDTNSGLNNSTFDLDSMSDNGTLANLLSDDQFKYIKYLMEGYFASDTATVASTTNVTPTATAIQDQNSTSVNGYVTNANLIHLPGQPGLSTPTFSLNMNIQPSGNAMSFPKKQFDCGSLFGACVGRALGNAFYNDMFRGLINILIGWIIDLFSMILQAFLYVPLSLLMEAFSGGVQLLQTTMIHPIIALAYMGASFINTSVEIWITLISFSILFGIFAGGLVIVAVSLILPFLASWLGVLAGVGWIDAYYAPFVPYMIFTFGSIAWFMAVIESMVAGPIVALGVTHPEGGEALGKAEHAVMILTNVFLRPAMMIIGYIASISLSYVTIFVLNSGFLRIMQFLIPDATTYGSAGDDYASAGSVNTASTPYINWAAMYASFFCLVTYTSLYLTVVQKSFTLIHILPDKILRWIGAQGEQYGQETQQWTEDAKGQTKEVGEATGKASMKLGGAAMSAAESVATSGAEEAVGGSTSAAAEAAPEAK